MESLDHNMDHCSVCPHHEYIVSIVEETKEDMTFVKDNINDIKISIAERNAFLKGIRTTLKFIATFISAIAAMIGYSQASKIIGLFK